MRFRIVTALVCLFVLFSSVEYAKCQSYAGEAIPDSLIRSWKPDKPGELEGSYHFSMSEDESELVFRKTMYGWTAQVIKGDWAGEDSTMRWVFQYENLTNIRVSGDTFYSDQYQGRFIQFLYSGTWKKALLIGNPWSSWVDGNGGDIGTWWEIRSIEGVYPWVSERFIFPNEIEEFSLEQLKIMRNEVYARYGHVFRAGGEMESYFSKQEWYTPVYTSVERFLTDIERLNVQIILNRERKLRENDEKG